MYIYIHTLISMFTAGETYSQLVGKTVSNRVRIAMCAFCL